MKLPPSSIVCPLFLLSLLLGGCASPEVSRVVPIASKAPVAPVTPALSAPPAAAASKPEPKLQALAPEVASVVVHLTETAQTDILAHDRVDTTGFPEALASLAPGAKAPKVEKIDTRFQPPPRGLTAEGDSIGLVERDWTGLVLVPINKSLSKAYTSAVRLLKVEAHPLQDGRIRVWIRMQNIDRKQLPSEVACVFGMRTDAQPANPYFYELQVPTGEYRDVFFVSPAGELVTYTVLIRSNNVNYRVSAR